MCQVSPELLLWLDWHTGVTEAFWQKSQENESLLLRS